MKFSLISDMHINHPQPRTPYDQLEHIVVVAGDTDNGLGGLKYLQKLKNKGYTVIATHGNHEHYSNVAQDRTMCDTINRFQQDHPDFYDFGKDVPLFVARNGWYIVKDEPLWYNYMNDGRYGGFGADEVNSWAKMDSIRVKSVLRLAQLTNRKVVVVTHTAPCEESLNQEYKDHYSQSWYWNPLMRPLLEEYKDTIAVWCHGHTHAQADVVVDGVRVVANPRGYPRENPDWMPLTIEV